jgi:hypothetical protein
VPPARAPRQLGLAVAGLATGLAGVVGYLVVVFHLGGRLPSVRNGAVPNWILVGLGLALSTAALVRARRRTAPALLLLVNGGVAAAFAALLFVITALPPATGPAIGAPAPSFTLQDQARRPIRLEDFRGKPLLLVFYRGHW